MFLEVLFFSALAILVGLAFTFLGYQFFRILLPIWAFFVGLWLGVGATAAIFGGGFLTSALGLVLGFFIGLVLAALSYFVYSVAVVLFGASLGYTLGAGLMLLIGFDPGFISWLVGMVFAVAFGLMFIVGKFPKIVIIVGTALAGAMAVFAGILILFGVIPPESLGLGFAKPIVSNSFLLTVGWITLAVIGMATQYSVAQSSEEMLMEEFVVEEPADAKPKSKKSTK
jgi:hypothetical protein